MSQPRDLSDSTAPGERPGELIDRYRLVEPIGEGGMGTVWRAEQSEPVTRTVALKVIKLGMDTREVVVRFEAERQALALMDHPGIAKVLDGGATASGRPFFVMELVDGAPITQYCDERKLPLHARLELFTQVCEAIQHAHQKGIIHRDIKPSNVLVAERDGVAHPKVIDFGIAKATGAEWTERTMFTQVGQMVGTPEYMAPEQAGAGELDIDTRADVYSLGVLLYELLTGTKPFDLESVVGSGYEELLRTIREVDPAKPSTRISSLGKSASLIAATRHVETAALARRLSGDLDWIVMKALEKDRSRRYGTANGFALDVQRFLKHEAVLAAPPSALYRWRKLVRRRKKTVAALAVIAVLFLAGSIGTGVGLWRTMRANRALDVALEEKGAALLEEERQRKLAESNATRAAEAEAEARSEAARATEAEARAEARARELAQVAEFQSAQLSSIDPQLMGVRLRRTLLEAAPADRRETLRESLSGSNFTSVALEVLEQNLFDRTIEAIDSQFAQQPLVRARLLHTMGSTLLHLGLLERARDPLKRALAIRRSELGDGDHVTLLTVVDLARLERSQGRLAEAEALDREALDGLTRLLGNDHADTLAANLQLGSLLEVQGKPTEAEPFMRKALEGFRRTLGGEHPSTVNAIAHMAVLARSQGDPARAELYYREALEINRRVLGDEAPKTLICLDNLGLLLQEMGKFEEAESCIREALDGSRRVLGDDHPDTLITMQNLGLLLEQLGKLKEAEGYHREALESARRILGDEHGVTLKMVGNLALSLQYQGRLEEAELYCREALEGRRRVLGEEHPDTLTAIHNMGFLLGAQGESEQAEAFYREALEKRRRILGDEHVKTLSSMHCVGYELRVQGKPALAEPYLQECLPKLRALLGEEHLRTRTVTADLSDVLQGLVQAARTAGDERLLGETLTRLGSFRLSCANPAGAEPPLAEALDLFIQVSPENDARMWQVLSLLGTAIAGQGRHAEAEPLLLESGEGILADASGSGSENLEHMDATESVLQRLIEFYEGWDISEPDEAHVARAEQWRTRLEDWRQRAIAQPGK